MLFLFEAKSYNGLTRYIFRSFNLYSDVEFDCFRKNVDTGVIQNATYYEDGSTNILAFTPSKRAEIHSDLIRYRKKKSAPKISVFGRLFCLIDLKVCV